MVEINALGLLALFSITIVVGYVGSLIFGKTRIADDVWLILFGLLVGPVLGLMDRNLFLFISPFLAALALLLILFDAGLNMNFYQMIRGAPRGMLLAITVFGLSIAVTVIITTYLLGFDLMTALLLGAILGGTSSPTVLALASKLNLNRKNKIILELETIFNDPLVIVVALVLAGIISHTYSTSPAQAILSSFSIGAVVGLVVGLVWLFVLDKLKGKPFDYMLTLAVLFLAYVVIEQTGGSGAIGALIFGLVLGNAKIFSVMLRFKRKFTVNKLMFTFHSEVSFFIRAFFFVYLGIIATINPEYLFYGIVIASGLIIIRFIAVRMSLVGLDVTEREIELMGVMGPRGLATAVLAQMPLSLGLPHGEAISNIVFIVILATVLYSSFAVMMLSKKKGKVKMPEKPSKIRPSI